MNLFPRVPNSKRAKADAARAGGQLPGPGMAGMNGPFGVIARALETVVGLVPVKAPGGGIPALSAAVPGSADCTLMAWNGTSFQVTTPAVTVQVRNFWDVAVGANKQAVAFRWAGSYWALTWRC